MTEDAGARRGEPRTPVRPAPSATVVLARRGRHGAEFFLVRRNARTAFGASYVFPGGLVEPQDRAVHDQCRGLSAAAADRCLRIAEGGLDYYSAAIRELFEETGVLLARDAAGHMPPAAKSPDPGPESPERRALLAGDGSWPDLLRRYGLTLAVDELDYFAWWITPAARPRRFSTRFFMAEMPPGQTAVADGEELTDGRWLTAEAALAAGQAGSLSLPPPTIATLRDLAAIPELAALRTWTIRRSAAGVTPVLPVVLLATGGERVVLPGDPDYPAPAPGEIA